MANKNFEAFKSAVMRYDGLRAAGFPAVINYIVHPEKGYIFSVDVGPRWEVYPSTIRRADVARLCRESGGHWLPLDEVDVPDRPKCKYIPSAVVRPGKRVTHEVEIFDERGRLVEVKTIHGQKGGVYILAKMVIPGVGVLDSDWAREYLPKRTLISRETAEKVLRYIQRCGLWKTKRKINWKISLLGFNPNDKSLAAPGKEDDAA